MEYKVKAAFLVNFARFISWPSNSFPSDLAPFTLCIAGDNPFGSAFSGIDGKIIKGRNTIVKKCNSLQQTEKCNLLYISTSKRNVLNQYLEYTSSKSIVTVSDINRSAYLGGTIEFVEKNGRLSFKINNSSAKAEGLNVDASLLDLAAEVY